MAAATTFPTPYDLRVKLVTDTILANSKISDDAAATLAVHVLQAINAVPEKMR